MPSRRRRTTNRKPQDERRLRIRGDRRDVPDAKTLSRAFIGLALARAEAEAQAQREVSLGGKRAERSGDADGNR